MTSIEILDERKITRKQFYILFFCFICMALDGFDLTIIAISAPFISRDLQITPEQMGIVFSSALLGMTLGSMFLGSLADKYGRKVIVSLSLATIGLFTAAVFHVESATTLIWARFFAGLGLGAMMSSLPAFASEYSPRLRRAFILSIMMAGMSTGSVIGGLIASALIIEFGWKIIYLYAGIITTLSGLIFFLFIPESVHFIFKKNGVGALERINKTLQKIGHDTVQNLPEAGVAIAPSSVKSLFTPSRARTTLFIWVGFFSGFTGAYFIINWLPIILVDSGIAEGSSIQAVVVLSFGNIIGAVFIGWLSRWWAINKLISIAFLSTAFLFIFFGILLNGDHLLSVIMIMFFSFIIGLLLQGAFANIYTIPLTVYPTEVKSTGLGWSIGLGRLGGIVAPFFAGKLIALGIPSSVAMMYFSIPMILSAVIIWWINVREIRSYKEHSKAPKLEAYEKPLHD